jgi:tRNA dimethylallyltransferase
MAELNATQSKQKYLIIIAGPTAIGKTALSIKIGQKYNCPIISFDSRQFYNEMSIGTAKPTAEELALAEHHFINSRSITELYTAGMFENDAIQRLDLLFKKHDICVAVGGSGLYIDALCDGIDEIPADKEIRESLHKRWKEEGLEVLQEEVKQHDPEFYEIGDMKNPRRVIRALEVFEATGKTYSSFRTNPKKERSFNTIWIGLEMDLQELYERINLRVDQMMENGLLEEVNSLRDKSDLKALKTVGYREILDHFSGLHDLDTAIELIKRNSRRYAKKQFTWFQKRNEIFWFNPEDETAIYKFVQGKLS